MQGRRKSKLSRGRGGMSRVNRAAILIPLFVSISAMGSRSESQTAIDHPGFSPRDEFVFCAGRVFGALVFVADSGPQPSPTPCPAPAETITRDLAAQGIRTIRGPRSVYLMPERLFAYSPTQPFVRWRTISIEPSVTQWPATASARRLTADEERDISQAIFKVARTPLVAPEYDIGPDPQVRAVDVPLALMTARILRDRESVLGIWGRDMGVRRLIYGEMTATGYKPLWDSPLMPGFFIALRLLDVNHDGTKEIIATARYGSSGRFMLTMFDVNGRELTRQNDCVTTGFPIDETNGVCPINGEDMSFDEKPDHTVDILVDDWNGPRRFALVGGRYVLQ